MNVLHRIRQAVRDRQYYLSAHAEEEMWVDDLERADVEHCLLYGQLERRLTHDARGTRYRIEGLSVDGRLMHVICRFQPVSDMLIVTVYVVEVEV